MKRIIALLLAVLMLLSLAACAAKTGSETADAPASTEPTQTPAAETETPSTEEPEQTGNDQVLKLQWYQQKGIDTLFESPWTDMQCLLPYMLFESLYVQNSDGSFVPLLATDYTISDDALTFTFTIREGVKWHDGADFTINDVVWSFNTYAAAGGAFIQPLTYIEGYDAVANGEAKELSGLSVDGNVLTIKLAQPFRGFMYGLCVIKILPEHLLGDVAIEEVASVESFWSNPVGTGMYMLDKIAFPDYCTLKINDAYWGTKPTISSVLFTNYYAGGNDAVVAALVAGDLDFAWKNALNDVEVANNVVAQNADMVAKMTTSFYTRFFVFNLGMRADGNNKDDLLKKEVRQAFNLLIDKNAMASFYEGQAVALSTMVNPASSAYNDDIPQPAKDVDTAKAMLEEAGFDFNQVIDLAYYYDDQTTADIMAMIKQDFASAGVQVETHLLTGDLATLIYTDANYDLIYLASSGATDPVNLHNFLTSATPYSFMGQTEERAAIFDEPFAAYHASVSDADAKRTGDTLQALAYEYCYGIPGYSLNAIEIYNSKKLTLPDTLLEMDNETGRNWMFAEWRIN